ncbi:MULTISPECIES: SslE/AcfD family lipoprotein zinc metalloprotease [unclassified Photobacterium]|uniref:SslE/AcfD family lipoprotein zinc metalloprotease n=1 Tax=unclassified Photobacterium TaxID=2628852 RepID=UPI001EDD6D8F|nr:MULTISPECIES: SslE/AcfD family lipoprotein zinc metalloprotease [unclassified Photobacterium]MCG3863985.1 SslE/AcfD family lipoprotein zinc metalloprotease [Photobacterium sp. Ph6]MCG3875487.1 SslE/AcfD family lipoprotein zinc metalloprotease [Photobacterium sp. Ph5]
MQKKLIAVAISSSILLMGCHGDDTSNTTIIPPTEILPSEPLPEPDIDDPEITPPPVEPPTEPEITPPVVDPETGDPEVIPPVEPDPTATALFALDSDLRFGNSVLCNGETANSLIINNADTVSCYYGAVELATFSNIELKITKGTALEKVKRLNLADSDRFVAITDAIELQNALDNTRSLLLKSGTSIGGVVELSLSSAEQVHFNSLYHSTELQTLSKDEFNKLLVDKVEDNTEADSKPSTHEPNVKPEVTPGTSDDLNSNFVSANAEANLVYQPTKVILSQGTLVDSHNKPVQGIEYYSHSSRGITDEQGKFSFNWGETVSFGIDTFELGEIKANKTQFSIADLGAEHLGRNAERLLQRYSHDDSQIVINDRVCQVFAMYPNVINEAINLSLSEPVMLDNGTGTQTPIDGEFDKQFNQGLALDIDTAICEGKCSSTRSISSLSFPRVMDAGGNIQADILKLWGAGVDAQSEGWKPVTKFHVFSDETWYYGSPGYPRGQGAINISNAAFPVLMPRNDNNFWLRFGEKKAWDERSLAYITESPSTVKPDLVSGNTATFNLPFISIGEVGAGKVMLLGNSKYNTILVCPDGFSWDNGVSDNGACWNNTQDSEDMANFFFNTFRYLIGDKYTTSAEPINIGTNIPDVYFRRSGHLIIGNKAPFVIDPRFNMTAQQLSSFSGIDPADMPLLILNGYENSVSISDEIPSLANTDQPKLTQQDVSDLLNYVERGGNILIMESITKRVNDDFTRLLDGAGLAINGQSTAGGNGPSYGYPDRVRSQRQHDYWVLERYAAVKDGDTDKLKQPYNIDEVTGTVTWDFIENKKPDDKPELEVARKIIKNEQGENVQLLAFIDTYEKGEKRAPEAIEADKQRILKEFNVKECTLTDYHYEINCLEYRPGNDIRLSGGMHRALYKELPLDEATAKAMIKAADLGTNIERLYQHELYFRTRGSQGERLSSVDLNRIYQNMTVWLWNDLDYRFESGKEDELGFERFTEFLNCYGDTAAGQTTCSDALKQSLESNNMVYSNNAGKYAGWMNPSYPLNYMEKPLTRLMLGRTYFDLDIKADVRQYPGEVTTSGGSTSITVDLSNNTAAWFAGNRQATGQWAIAHEPMTITASGNSNPITVTVALADDLTGREKHELGLKRPPRMTKTFTLQPNATANFTTPYGGLVYVQGNETNPVTLNFSGTVNAPWFKVDKWVNDQSSPAPIGEIESNTFIYTAAAENLTASNYGGDRTKFAAELDMFSADVNDFYARDEAVGEGNGRNGKATDSTRSNNKHHFVNDIAISIGAAHSGYPVMNGSFNKTSTLLSTTPLNDWLLWHEVGHNAAEAPFNVEGATEVVNNMLALYMQDKYLGKMTRVEADIKMAPNFVRLEQGHAWAAGGNSERLLMFAQLKEWAEQEFDINNVIKAPLPSYYANTVTGLKGWDLIKLMHRLTRNSEEDNTLLPTNNVCRDQSGLSKGDQLMLCASYATQKDLSDFFAAWNPGSKAYLVPGESKPQYEGGITSAGLSAVQALKLPKPMLDPLSINAITITNR